MFCCSTKVIPHFLIIVPYASTVVIKGKQIPLGRKRLKFLSSINMRVFSTAAAALAVFGITSGLQQPLAMDTFPLKYQAGDEVLVKASKYLNAPLSGLTEEIRELWKQFVYHTDIVDGLKSSGGFSKITKQPLISTSKIKLCQTTN